MTDLDERRAALAGAGWTWASAWGLYFLVSAISKEPGNPSSGLLLLVLVILVVAGVRYAQAAWKDGAGLALLGAASVLLPFVPIFPLVAWRKRASLQPFAGYL